MGLVPFALVGFAGTSLPSLPSASGETLAGPVGALLTPVTENWV